MSASTDEEQLAELVGLVRDVLGPDVVGAYLHGSAVLGGQLPTSDLDLLVVCRRPTTVGQRARLGRGLLALSTSPTGEDHARSGRRPVELTLVVEAAVRPWRFPAVMDFQYGGWMRADFEAGRIPAPAPNPDLAILIELARRGDVAVIGPPATELFAPVPWTDVVAGMTAGIDGLLDELEADTRNVLLTLARIWMTLATGEIRRKDAAAAWAAERMSSELGGVIARAGDLYLAGEYGPWRGLAALVPAAANQIVSEIRRLAPD